MTSPERFKVMVVDDHPVVREGVRDVLETSGHFKVVVEASDGEEAVAKAASQKPNVIVMDVFMPCMDGIEACRDIMELLPEMRVIVRREDGCGGVLRRSESTPVHPGHWFFCQRRRQNVPLGLWTFREMDLTGGSHFADMGYPGSIIESHFRRTLDRAFSLDFNTGVLQHHAARDEGWPDYRSGTPRARKPSRRHQYSLGRWRKAPDGVAGEAIMEPLVLELTITAYETRRNTGRVPVNWRFGNGLARANSIVSTPGYSTANEFKFAAISPIAGT